MKIACHYLVVALLSLPVVAQENFTQNNVNQTNAILEKVFTAYGGELKIQNIQQIIVDYKVTNTAVGQSVRPGPPWDINHAKQKSAFDFESQQALVTFKGEGGGGKFSQGNIWNGENSFNYDDISKTVFATAAPEFEQRIGPNMRSNGTFLVKRLLQHRGSARYLGDIQLADLPHQLVAFTMPGGPAITLYFNHKTHLLSKSERVVGNFLVEYYFDDYRAVEGVQFPYSNRYTVNGDPSQTFDVAKYVLNQKFDELLKKPNGYVEVPQQAPAQMKTEKVADGVYWVANNNQNSLFVEFNDYVLMVGGLNGAGQRIAELKKTIPNKPIKYAVMTHHHSDHIGGSQDIHNEGITFVAANTHQETIRDTLEESHRSKAKFAIVKQKKVFKDATQRVEVHNIGPTPHTEQFLLVYLPKQKVIFEADHFRIPNGGPVSPRSPNVEALVNAINSLKLKVETITSSHGTQIGTMKQLEDSFNKKA